jgi:hypothetical protein
MMRLAWVNGRLAAVQREMAPARLAWFTRPADPRLQWPAERLDEGISLAQPETLAAADFDRDGRPDLMVAERAGRGRILVFRDGRAQEIASGEPVLRAAAADLNGDGRPDILVLRDGSISWYESRTPASR